MHSPESLNNNSAKEDEERREEQGQQRHHFSPEGKMCKEQSGLRVAQFLLEQFLSTPSNTVQFPPEPWLLSWGLKDKQDFELCPAPTPKEDQNGSILKKVTGKW